MAVAGLTRTAFEPEPGDLIVLLKRQDYSRIYPDIARDKLYVAPWVTVRPNGPPEQDGRIRLWESDRSWSSEEWRAVMHEWGGVLVGTIDAGEDN